MKERYTSLNITPNYFDKEPGRFNSYHEFGHAVFNCFAKNEIVGISILKKNGGGNCRYYKNSNIFGESYIAQEMMIHLAGDISTIFFLNKVHIKTSITDIEKYTDNYRTLRNEDLLEETYSYISKESNKLGKLNNKEYQLINEYIDYMTEYYFVFKSTDFVDFTYAVVELMFKLFREVNYEVKAMAEAYKDKSYITSKTCLKLTGSFTKKFDKIKKTYSLNFV
jgi:hypothetical protein